MFFYYIYLETNMEEILCFTLTVLVMTILKGTNNAYLEHSYQRDK